MKTRNVMKALTVALLLSSSAVAQIQISGEVKNEEGVPIEGATVSLKDKNKGAVTNENGHYLIESLEKGTYEIRVQIFGYDAQSKTINLEESIVVNFALGSSYFLQEGIDVQAVRAGKKTPTTYTNIDEEAIEKMNYGQDLPYLLQSVPSTVVSSDAGAGVGYTGYRIRGIDPTRINVTVDGIPINDGESQDIFWVNMSDFASSMSSMQIQRGVGTSSNGSSAFGSSINISTDKVNQKPYAILDNTFGSFNTIKNTFAAGTGIMKNKFSVDARLSHISSDGYIDRANTKLKSYYVQGAYHGKKSKLRLIVFGGNEKTYQAWFGTPESRIKNDHQGMLDYAARNGLSDEETENLLNSGRTYNAYTYSNETDNYQQNHYQLHYAYQFNSKWNMKVAAYLTTGEGYYENYRANDKFSTYGFTPVVVKGDTIKRMDMIRQKWLNNSFYGGIFNVNYNNLKGFELVIGGGMSQYRGKHYSRIIWGEHMEDNQIDKRYFENDGLKNDGNIYVKANYQVKKINFFADVQYRYVDYSFLGIDEYDGIIEERDQKVVYNFFNPKAGLSYTFNLHNSIYASYAIANREPVRKDFREQSSDQYPSPETLYNLEAGYRLEYKKGYLNANVYHMLYHNQLVLTGEINDVGGYTRANVDDSYRLGLELEGGYQIFKKLGLTANFALSQNKVKNFVEYVDQYDASWNPLPQRAIEHGTTDLAFAPSIIGGLSIHYAPIKGLTISLMNKYVGKQFLDNTSNDSRAMPAYFISHFDVAYSFSIWGLKEITVSGRINNLFNQMYESNGYTYSYYLGEDRIQDNLYYPQAGINFLVRLMLKF